MTIRLSALKIKFDDNTVVTPEWFDQFFGTGAFPTAGTELKIKKGSRFESAPVGTTIGTIETPVGTGATSFILEYTTPGPGSVAIPAVISEKIYVYAVGGGGGSSARGGPLGFDGTATTLGTISAGGGQGAGAVNNGAPLNTGGPGGVASGGEINVNGSQGGPVITTAQAGNGGPSGEAIRYGGGLGAGGAGAPPNGGNNRFGADGVLAGGGGGGGYFAGPPTGNDTRSCGGGGGALAIHTQYRVVPGYSVNFVVGDPGAGGAPSGAGAGGRLKLIFYDNPFDG